MTKAELQDEVDRLRVENTRLIGVIASLSRRPAPYSAPLPVPPRPYEQSNPIYPIPQWMLVQPLPPAIS